MKQKETQSLYAAPVSEQDIVDNASSFAQITPELDFSAQKADTRKVARQMEYGEGYRRAQRNSEQAYIPWREGGTLVLQPEQTQSSLASYWTGQAAKFASDNAYRNRRLDISAYPSVQQLIDDAAKNGQTYTVDDIANLVDMTMLNDAADAVLGFVAASKGNPIGLAAGDPNALYTVMGTLLDQGGVENDPFKQRQRYMMAALLPDVIQQRLDELSTDPTVLENLANGAAEFLGAVGDVYMEVVQGPIQRSFRALNYEIDSAEDSFWPKVAGFGKGIYAALSGGRAEQLPINPGDLDETYIQTLRDQANPDGTPRYTPLQFEIVTELVRREALGDPEPVRSLWSEKYLGNVEAAKIFGDLLYAYTGGNTKELFLQVKSADMSDTGWTALRGVNKLDSKQFAEWRSSKVAHTTADIAELALSVMLDPTIVGAKVFRTAQAARWALMKLAPGAETSAVKVLEPLAKVGNVTIHTPASRKFAFFANRLNRLDEAVAESKAATREARDLGRAASTPSEVRAADRAQRRAARANRRAASIRMSISRQFDEMPEQLIEDFRTTMKRNKDGRFDLRTTAEWIDDTNRAYQMTLGEIGPDLVAAGAADAAKRAYLFELMDRAVEAGVPGAASMVAEQKATILGQLRTLEEAQSRTFVSQVSRKSMDRELLIPRLTVVGSVRDRAVNQLKMAFLTPSAVDRLVAQHMPSTDDPALFAQQLSDSAVQIGKAIRANKYLNVPDSFARSFSSLPDVSVLELSNASTTIPFYRLARAFLPRQLAQVLAEQWRMGTPASRRLLATGVVRASAAARGITLSVAQAEELMRTGQIAARRGRTGLVTGVQAGEQYGVSVPEGLLPSQRAAAVEAGLAVPESPVVVSLSRDANGIEHALHIEQTATQMRIPSIKEFEDLRAAKNVALATYYHMGNAAGRVTDAWSAYTLAAPRTGFRNAIDEGMFYGFGSGPIAPVFKGRAADQAIRRAMPRWAARIDKKTGAQETVARSNLGVTASTLTRLSKLLNRRGLPEWLTNLIYTYVDEDTALKAAAALEKNDPRAMQTLLKRVQVARKLGKKTWSSLNADDMVAVDALVASGHGQTLYDEIVGAASYMSSAKLPDFALDADTIDFAGRGVSWGRLGADRQLKTEGFSGEVPTIQGGDPPNLGVTAWWNKLRMTLTTDGPIGETAVRMLDDPPAAKAEIARILREEPTFTYNDEVFNYRDLLTRASTDQGVDDFANAYFEDVFNLFTRADGSLNRDLQAKFLERGEGGIPRAAWAVDGVEGPVQKVTLDDLTSTKTDDRPQFVQGPKFGQWIPMPADDPALLSPTWVFGATGRMNARLSRGPIFIGNYLTRWRQMKPARDSAAQKLAEAAGRSAPNADDIALANELYARSAMDSAFNLTLSFVDNPSNRSNFAWKIRNYSRYWRATEDFMRRTWRLAKTRPESFVKLAVVLNALNETSFTARDENGDTYFVYPGSEYALDMVSGVVKQVTGQDIRAPWLFTGKLAGLTPSSDLKQFGPYATGPAAASLNMMFNLFPGLYRMKGLQYATLGPYAKVSGDAFADFVGAITPLGVTRAMEAMDPDQRDALIGQAGFDALALMAANKQLDEVTINGQKVSFNSIDRLDVFQMSREYQAAQMMGWALAVAKVGLSFGGPAAPKAMSNTVSSEARDLGVTGMKPLFRTLLDVYKDDPNAYELAVNDFMSMQADRVIAGEDVPATDFLPFTLSTYKANDSSPDANRDALARVQASVKPLLSWWNDADTQDLVAQGYRGAVLFLAPRTGEFDWGSWTLAKNDLKLFTKKSEGDMIMDLLALDGRYQDGLIRRSYDDAIAALDPADPGYKQTLAQLNEGKSNDLTQNKLINPAWSVQDGQRNQAYTKENYRSLFADARDMLTYLQKRDGELEGTAYWMNQAIQVYLAAQNEKAAFQGSSRYAVSGRKEIDYRTNADYAQIAAVDPGAGVFIESVLANLTYEPTDPAFRSN